MTSRINPKNDSVRLALPSDGALYETTQQFLRGAGMDVRRPSSRQYTGSISSLANVVVLFQRAADIPAKVEEGTADVGIVGLDRFLESSPEMGNSLVVIDDLAYGSCELVVAVPDFWVDVESVTDLAELAIESREQGRRFRLATKYPKLVQEFLVSKGVHYIELAPTSGTVEAAPATGYAELIADLTASGATLRENHLKTLTDGIVLSSQACMIANKNSLGSNETKLTTTRQILERAEAFLKAKDYCIITAQVPETSDTADQDFRSGFDVQVIPEVTATRGANTSANGYIRLEVIASQNHIVDITASLRELGAQAIATTALKYLFLEKCRSYSRLEAAIKGDQIGTN